MTLKRFEYWSNKGKVWTDWFPWNCDWKPEFQIKDRRIVNRLKNEYNESICTNN